MNFKLDDVGGENCKSVFLLSTAIFLVVGLLEFSKLGGEWVNLNLG